MTQYHEITRKVNSQKPSKRFIKKQIMKIASKHMNAVRRYLMSKGVTFSKPGPGKQEIANAILAYQKVDVTINRQKDANNIINEFAKSHLILPGNIVTAKKQAYQTKHQERKAFYASDKWRALRYEALKIYGRRCLVCGTTPELGAVLHVDHVKPRSLYPELELSLANLQILCLDCNLGKSNKDSIDYRQHCQETE